MLDTSTRIRNLPSSSPLTPSKENKTKENFLISKRSFSLSLSLTSWQVIFIIFPTSAEFIIFKCQEQQKFFEKVKNFSNLKIWNNVFKKQMTRLICVNVLESFARKKMLSKKLIRNFPTPFVLIAWDLECAFEWKLRLVKI